MYGMLGTIVNTVAVLIGGALGLLFKKAIPEKLSDTVFKGLGLCTLFIGITGVHNKHFRPEKRTVPGQESRDP